MAGRGPRCGLGGAKLQQVRDKSKEKPDFFSVPARQPLHGRAGVQADGARVGGAPSAGACRAVPSRLAMACRAGCLSAWINIFRKAGRLAQCPMPQRVALPAILLCDVACLAVRNGQHRGLEWPILQGKSVLASS